MPHSYDYDAIVIGSGPGGEGAAMAAKLIALGGFGHTSVLYCDEKEQDKINTYGKTVKTSRVLINMPASQGAIGDIYNFRLEPSLTLGCVSETSISSVLNHLSHSDAEAGETTLYQRM